ncbi:MAG: hypothetical protein U0804_13875 [Gemmataceae bacterium]
MGHAQIDRLPRTKEWRAVVALLRENADAATVARAVVDAVRTLILPLAKDRGVVEATWHLLRLPLAAADDDYPAGLRRAGLDVADPPGLMDLVAAVSDALDREVPVGRRTDLGEMAHTALVETLAGHAADAAADLYGEEAERLRAAVAATATVRRFGALAAGYFARVVRKGPPTTSSTSSSPPSPRPARTCGRGAGSTSGTPTRSGCRSATPRPRPACGCVSAWCG